MTRRIRIGIDVGGTFTKAVAIDMLEGKITGKITVPTTHSSKEGVSVGIIKALSTLMVENAINNSEIELISHSTTQAVNALLEGDTVKVGIIGMGVSLEKSNVIKRTKVSQVQLAPGKYLETCYRYLDTSRYLQDNEVIQSIAELKKEGAEVLVVSEAYGVDDPSNECFVMEKSDIPSTAGHELTGVYGLEIRTLTAAINAGILPRAINTARFVEEAVMKEKIEAPLMIMKGDGGVTDMKTFMSKPIVTVLSGPAASVAGALLHLHVLDGIFVEVGGTSTNVCIIKNGRPEIRYVTINQHPTCIRSLDVRVAGVAGGSLVRINNKKIIDIGPRSAHIASLPYSCFAETADLQDGKIVSFRPRQGDPDDYVAIEKDGKRFAITNTCAANALGIISSTDYAFAKSDSARLALGMLAEKIGVTMEEAAATILEISTRKILEIVMPMLKEYKVNRDRAIFVGGGGGAAVLVPNVAGKLQLKYKIADHAEVISSIGVAAAMIHEEIERTINNPSPEDVTSIIGDVKDAALKKGAYPESLTIQSEYVSERSLLRATAIGNVKLDIGTVNAKEINDKQAEDIASEILGKSEGLSKLYDSQNYHIFSCELRRKRLFIKEKKQPVVVLDRFGRVRLSIDNAAIYNGTPDEVAASLEQVLNGSSKKRDDLAPQVHLLDGVKIIDFSSLSSPEHVSKAIREELKKADTERITAIVKI